MTQAVARPRAAAPKRRTAAQAAPVSPLWLRSLMAAVWTVAVGLAVLVVIAVIVWSADSRTTSSAGDALRFAVTVWLAGQHAPLSVGGGTVAIAPLGLTVLLGVLLARFAAVLSRAATSQEPGAVAAMVLAVTIPYAGIAAALAAVARTDAIRPSVPGAFLAAAGLSLVATTAGGIRGAGQWRAAWGRLPVSLRDGLRAAGVAGAVIAGAALALTIASVVDHWSLVSNSFNGYGNGSGKFTMGLLSLWLLPNAVLFTTAYLTGTGFAVGAGATVTLGGAHVGATPALPLLAAVPHHAAPVPVVVLAFVAVGAAAALAAWRIRRDAADSLGDQARAAAALAAVVAAGTAALTAVAGGPAGPGRLTAFGPSPWQAGLTVAAEVAGPVLLFIAAQAWWRMWRALPGR
ncbi:MAG TPA: DUF6350 family protein [Mycobacteriales bacterium]|nr:DUF6350 family protein [Mycobacteriales bacterium]